MDKETEKNRLRRYLNGTYVTSEVDELHDELRDALKDNELLDEMASEVWEESADLKSSTTFVNQHSYNEAQQILKDLKHKKTWNLKRFSYAAVGIAASFILAFLGMHNLAKLDNAPVQMAEVSTGFGERKQVLLADGSRVVLNACSSLQYPKEFEDDVRKVQLNGQAYFEVARNEKQPFFVETGKFHVQVLGTEFDVKSYTDDEIVSVEVKSGKVEVTLPEAMLRLKKDEQVLMNTVSGEFNKKKENKEVATWRKGSLCFNHTPIRDVARELERIYNCTIEFSEGQEFVNVITGEHENQSLESILESLHIVSGINYRKAADGSILIYK